MKMTFVAPALALAFCASACSSAPQGESVSRTDQAIVSLTPVNTVNIPIQLPPWALTLGCPTGSTCEPDCTAPSYSCDWIDGYFTFSEVTGKGTPGAYDPGCSTSTTDAGGSALDVPGALDGNGCSLGIWYKQYPTADGGPVWACRADLIASHLPLPAGYSTVALPAAAAGIAAGSQCVGAANSGYVLVRGSCGSTPAEMTQNCPSPIAAETLLTVGGLIPINLGGSSSGSSGSSGALENMGCGGPCSWP